MAFLDFLSPGKKRAEKRAVLIEEANSFVEQIKQNKGLTPIASGLLLKPEEEAFLETNSVLQETRAIRYHKRGGAGFRVMKGVWIGAGSGTSESKDEWRVIDQGKLTLTNKKLVFDGSKGDRVIPLNKIISINPWLDGIEVSTENRSKSMLLSVNNPFIWAAVINVLNKVEDPRKIEGGIDIAFK